MVHMACTVDVLGYEESPMVQVVLSLVVIENPELYWPETVTILTSMLVVRHGCS